MSPFFSVLSFNLRALVALHSYTVGKKLLCLSQNYTNSATELAETDFQAGCQGLAAVL